MKPTTSPTAPRHERDMGKLVPYSRHVTPTIIVTENWEYLSVWRIGGRTFEGYPDDELCTWLDELNNIIKGFPAGFGMWTHLVRRRVQEYPESAYPDAFSESHDAAYRRTFVGKPPMVNDLYLTVIVRANVDPALRMLSRFEKRTARDVHAWQSQAIEQLDDINRKLASALRRYGPDLLSIVERDTTDPDHPTDATRYTGRFSEPAEFFGFLLNGKTEPVPALEAKLSSYLPAARPFFASPGDQAEVRGTNWSRRFCMVEIREYCNATKPGHLNRLMKLPFEFVLTQSFGTLSLSDGLAALTRQIKWLEDSKDYSESQIADLKKARDQLRAGAFVMGDHHATLAVYGEDSEETLRNAADVISTLADREIIGRLVDRALIAAFYAQLPTNWRWRPRPATITSQNFLSFSSLHNYLFGKPSGNPWGPAVTMLKTAGGTPYYLNFHASLADADETGKRRLGNTSIIGQSGTGKTVLLGHLLTQARKFGYTGAVFDKDRGLQVAIMAMGGKYFPLQLGQPTGWNYLQLTPTPRNVAFMRKLTVQLAAEGEQTANLTEQREIAGAVQKLVDFIDMKDRRLTTLLQFLPAAPSRDGKLSLRDKLERWCHGHENGWVFDNPRDELDLSDADLFGFDLTEFLEQGAIRDAALTYLLYRTRQMIDGRRFVYCFDEVQHPLKVPFFQEMMQNESRTIRKDNGVFIFATQEPDAILANPVGRSLIQQSATALYLANPKGTAEEYIDGFKLTTAEFKMVCELGEFSRQFVVKQGESTVTAELDLSLCPEALLVFSGSTDMAALAEAAVAERGSDPSQWLPLYLQRAKEAGRT